MGVKPYIWHVLFLIEYLTKMDKKLCMSGEKEENQISAVVHNPDRVSWVWPFLLWFKYGMLYVSPIIGFFSGLYACLDCYVPDLLIFSSVGQV